ncbi:MAG: acyl-ACP--UDP-N-acetylglucosamine O-acyltransferase [Gammaproteobacteria bacterium]|nr:acyl-ACP--UDP-N-acetylglucosamine O-acyltransferase [Gammaproteobacteria bacterium]
MSNQIHPTAIVSPSAELGNNNRIGPFAIIEDGVVLGNDNVIAAHAVLKTGTRMQDRNRVYEQAVIGGAPQHVKFTDETVATFTEIGNDNVFREGVTVNRGYIEGKATIVGDGNYLMTTAHFGHDCVVGNHNVFANSCALAGHVILGDRVFVSGGVMIHQFTHVGSYAMIGGNSKITQDVLPYMITDGNPAAVRGLNMVGLKRGGFSLDDIRALKQGYRLLFRRGSSLEANLAEMEAQDQPRISELVAFVQAADRGFHRAD